jgi:hypothetical protein
MQDTPITPMSLNLPGVDAGALQSQVSGNSLNGMTTQQKIDILFNRN